MPTSLYILLLVFITIALRQFIRTPIKIWHIMLVGAITALITKQISLPHAWHAVHWPVIIYLFGVFLIGQTLEESGYLKKLSYHLLKNIKNPKRLMFYSVFIFALASSILMNDTIAIIGTSTILALTANRKELLKPLLLALAFSITLGSVLSPVGNPQNLLIASSSLFENAFLSFFIHFIIPTLINLVATYFIVLFFYRDAFKLELIAPEKEPLLNKELAKTVKYSLALLVALILLNFVLGIFQTKLQLPFVWIAIIACMPILMHSNRLSLVKNIDWGSLVFFVAMFILIQSVWDSGFFQHLLNETSISIGSLLSIFVISILLSQFISNLPLVALYLPILIHLGANQQQLLALSSGSTIAGNLLIMGAASNIIIIQSAEKRGANPFHFFEFLKIGLPLTFINFMVYFIWLK
jgi:Na+/H+ antiporter NhaD/arsenite permease-like protein